jgi:tetratricopeptide (TPR) repeat protein
MRAVFDHSWRLLTAREQEIIQACSVFTGGFTRKAVQAVTSASLHELAALVSKSLLGQSPTGRYQLHELLQQYAAEKLARRPNAADGARDRHCAFYTSALEQWEADLQVDHENARAAWVWAVEQGQTARIAQAVDGLGWFYIWRGRAQEGEATFRLAATALSVNHRPAPADVPDTPPSPERPVLQGQDNAEPPVVSEAERLRVLVKILTWQGWLLGYQLGHLDAAEGMLRQACAYLDQPALADVDVRAERAFILFSIASIAPMSAAIEEDAMQLYESSLALYRALDDRYMTATLLGFMGGSMTDNYGEARRLREESLALRRALGDRLGIATSLAFLGVIALAQGQLEEGERFAREGWTVYQELGSRFGIAQGLHMLGWALWWQGRFSEARPLLEESVALFGDLGMHLNPFALGSNSIKGWVDLNLGRCEEARSQGSFVLTLAQESDNRGLIALSCTLLGYVELAEKAYVQAMELLQESAAGLRDMGERAWQGWALAGVGYAFRGLGDLCMAQTHLAEVLRTGVEIRAFMPLLNAVPAIALLLADRGAQQARGVELYALASRYPYVANSRWFEDVAGKQIAAIAATLPPDVVTAAQERGRARDLWETAQEMLEELKDDGSQVLMYNTENRTDLASLDKEH